MARDLKVPFTNEKPYYFISYNSEDEAVVSEYVKCLTDKGLPVWYDRALEVGRIWQEQISIHIAESETVIMFLSKNIFEKETSYVHKEFEMATEYFSKRIIVVLLDKIEKREVPPRFVMWWIDVNSLHCIEAFNCKDEAECADRILEAVSFKRSAVSAPAVTVEAAAPQPQVEEKQPTVTAETIIPKPQTAEIKPTVITDKGELAHLRRLADIAEERIVMVKTAAYLLDEDGSVWATNNHTGDCKWKNIKQLCEMKTAVAGLTNDGRVKISAYGDTVLNRFAVEYINSWKNVRRLRYVNEVLFGIKEDGTVYCSGSKINKTAVEKIRNWKNIKNVSYIRGRFVGVRFDGTLIAVSDEKSDKTSAYWQEICKWSGVEELYEYFSGVAALTSDGRVLTTKHTDGVAEEEKAVLRMSQWENMVRLYYEDSGGFFFGLCSDGSVRISDNVGGLNMAFWFDNEAKDKIGEWENIAGLKKGYYGLFGIRKDGTIRYTGENFCCKDYVCGFKLFDDIETLAAKIENK